MNSAQRSQLNIQTFHSYFWDFLRSHSYLIGSPKHLRILLPQDERAISGGIKERDDEDAWKDWLIKRDRLYFEDGRIAFDLFAPNAEALLRRSEHLRRIICQRHPLIIVDEAQDTGPHAWACIEQLASSTQILCLAELEQQIFDYLPGIGPERIDAIKKVLKPLEVDLGNQNYRSPGLEIVDFGQDILYSRIKGQPYKGVSCSLYHPKTADWAKTFRMSIGILQRHIRKETGGWGRSLAILTPSAASAAKISSALNSGPKPVRHKLLFDEAEALLAARFSAFLLEPKILNERSNNLAQAIEFLAASKRAIGSSQATKLIDWAEKIRVGKMPRAQLVTKIGALLDEISASPHTGDPGRDWLSIKRALRNSGQPELIKIASQLDYLIAFNRGKRIGANLSEAWLRDGQYTNARECLDLALVQDQLLDGLDDPDGIQVMTIHKSKGKQFDGVIVVREGRHNGQQFVSSFLWMGDSAPYHRSRKILRVAVTRAKFHTLILSPMWPACPILTGHIL
jgi:DNA helicase-2/ATP-dependent DNA helicase PcrA